MRKEPHTFFFVCSPYRATSASLLPTDDKVSRQPWRSCTSTVVIIESGRFFLSNNVIQVFPFEILGRAGKEILSSGLVEVDHGSVCRYSSRRRGRSRATKRLLFVKPVAWRPAQGEKPSGHKKRAGLVGLRGKRGRRTSDPVGWVDLMHLVDCTVCTNEVVSVGEGHPHPHPIPMSQTTATASVCIMNCTYAI